MAWFFSIQENMGNSLSWWITSLLVPFNSFSFPSNCICELGYFFGKRMKSRERVVCFPCLSWMRSLFLFFSRWINVFHDLRKDHRVFWGPIPNQELNRGHLAQPLRQQIVRYMARLPGPCPPGWVLLMAAGSSYFSQMPSKPRETFN